MSISDRLTLEDLQNFPLLHLVPPETIEGIFDFCTIREIGQGELLLHLDQSNRSMFLILTGCLSVRLYSLETEPVAYLRRGECVGEMSLIDSSGASAFVVAEADSRLLVLEEDLLWSLVQGSHAAACNLLKILTKRLRSADRHISSRLHLEQEIHRFGTVDALTGIHNRYWFDKILPRLTVRMEKAGQPLSLVMFDIDHFKQFNDRYGHLCGDQAIHSVGRILTESLRPNELAARFGGDEFLILLPDLDLDQAERVAERIRGRVLNTPVKMGDGSSHPAITISIGVAQARKGEAPKELLAAADSALYRAKQNGRNMISR